MNETNNTTYLVAPWMLTSLKLFPILFSIYHFYAILSEGPIEIIFAPLIIIAATIYAFKTQKPVAVPKFNSLASLEFTTAPNKFYPAKKLSIKVTDKSGKTYHFTTHTLGAWTYLKKLYKKHPELKKQSIKFELWDEFSSKIKKSSLEANSFGFITLAPFYILLLGFLFLTDEGAIPSIGNTYVLFGFAVRYFFFIVTSSLLLIVYLTVKAYHQPFKQFLSMLPKRSFAVLTIGIMTLIGSISLAANSYILPNFADRCWSHSDMIRAFASKDHTYKTKLNLGSQDITVLVDKMSALNKVKERLRREDIVHFGKDFGTIFALNQKQFTKIDLTKCKRLPTSIDQVPEGFLLVKLRNSEDVVLVPTSAVKGRVIKTSVIFSVFAKKETLSPSPS